MILKQNCICMTPALKAPVDFSSAKPQLMRHVLYVYLALMLLYSPLAIKFWYRNVLKGYGYYKPEVMYDRVLAAIVSLLLHLIVIPLTILTPYKNFTKGTTND